MTEVIVVCEGQSEEAFVNDVLDQALSAHGVCVQPRLVATSRHSSGGALTGHRVLTYLRRTLQQQQNTYVTTFFDLYGLPPGFPGHTGANLPSDPIGRATQIEGGFHAAVVGEAGCRPERFLPHIQPYEFEALLFSDISRFAETQSEWQAFTGQLAAVRRSVRSPEHINDGRETRPSAHLRHLVPRYNKVRHGVAVSTEIGIQRIRGECRHFNQWLSRLETLPPLREAE